MGSIFHLGFPSLSLLPSHWHLQKGHSKKVLVPTEHTGFEPSVRSCELLKRCFTFFSVMLLIAHLSAVTQKLFLVPSWLWHSFCLVHSKVGVNNQVSA